MKKSILILMISFFVINSILAFDSPEIGKMEKTFKVIGNCKFSIISTFTAACSFVLCENSENLFIRGNFVGYIVLNGVLLDLVVKSVERLREKFESEDNFYIKFNNAL